MQPERTQLRAAQIGTIANLMATGMFLMLASRVDDGATGYMIAAMLFALAAVFNGIRWRRVAAGDDV